MTETLERDKHGQLSSQPVVKRGPNRGKRLPETGGCWAYLCACLVADHYQGVVCGEVVRSLTREGFRLGHHDDDGVRSFYLWRSDAIMSGHV